MAAEIFDLLIGSNIYIPKIITEGGSWNGCLFPAVTYWQAYA